MSNMINSETLETAIAHIETTEIPLDERQRDEMQENYHRIAKILLSSRDEMGNTTLNAAQTEDLLDLLSQFNHISIELVREKKSMVRTYKRFLEESRKSIINKLPKFLKF